jgi:hypothetical protein
MHREQSILHNILGLIGRLPGTQQAAPRRRPQDRRYGRQETMVGGGITRIGRPHQVGPFMFLAAHRAPSEWYGLFSRMLRRPMANYPVPERPGCRSAIPFEPKIPSFCRDVATSGRSS